MSTSGRRQLHGTQGDLVEVSSEPPFRAEYIRRLEDAALVLWQELPGEQVSILRNEYPRLIDFLAHLHHSIEHEQVMVRQNVWAERADGGT